MEEDKQKLTFYGGKDGADYVCFDSEMKVVASGKEEDMLKLHETYGYAVGRLEAIRFVKKANFYFEERKSKKK